MKKYIALILIFILTLGVLLAGCKETEPVDESSSVIEQVVVEESKTEEPPETETLSAQDKAVKAEIAKYTQNAADFRYKKQEKIGNKTFNISFTELDSAADYKKVIYKNDLGDEFSYYVDTGELRYGVMTSAITEKTSQSINIETARKISDDYAAAQCNLDEYTMDESKEIDSGYWFCYTRYIGGYKTRDAFRIQIGFDGSIVYVNNNTGIFEGKNLNFTKEFIDAKINEALGDKENIERGSTSINLHDDKVCVVCSYIRTDEFGGKSGVNEIIPLE